MPFSLRTADAMPVAHHICRRACPQDISRSRALWECNRKLFDPKTWSALPLLLEDLLRQEVISLAIIETASSKLPRLLGGMSFVDPDYVKEARASSSTMHNFMFAAALRGRKPFLAPKQVAIGNARGTLNLMNFFGNFDVIDLSDAELANFYATSNEGYRFFHFGYNYKVISHEVYNSHQVAEDALADPYSRFCALFFPPKPRFHFSFGERMLLEYALLEYSDGEATSSLHLSVDAVKKRWRSIYRKVDMIAPALLSGAESGTAMRRTLLHHLRQHLEELRPYHEIA